MSAPDGEAPLVSVVVLGYNGRRHLERCLPTLVRQTYPRDRLELIVVDNASTDDTAAYVAATYPGIRLVRNTRNLGFAGGNNVGARAATGELVAFLNQDTQVDPAWVAELVAPIQRARRQGDRTLVCTGAKIVSWDGQQIDFAGARMNYLAKGSQHGFGLPVDRRYDVERPLLFACGGAMLIERDVFLACGGFDEDFFLFFEDVDLGWRLWVLGYRVQLAPRAITYHRLHGSVDLLHDARKRVLYERNALFAIVKNYDDANLARVLPAALLLTVGQLTDELVDEGLRPQDYDIRQRGALDETIPLPAASASLLVALKNLAAALPGLMARRAAIQAARRRPDREIVPLFAGPLDPLAESDTYVQASYELADLFRVTDSFASLPRQVLIVTADRVPLPGLPATGAGPRAAGLGQALAARGHQVTYAMHRSVLTGAGGNVPDALRERAWTEPTLDQVVWRESPDLVIICGWWSARWLTTPRFPVLIDLDGVAAPAGSTAACQLVTALARADLVSCASERQAAALAPWLARAGFAPDQPGGRPLVIPAALPPDPPAPQPAAEPVILWDATGAPANDPTAVLTGIVEVLEALGRGWLVVVGDPEPGVGGGGLVAWPGLRARLARSPRVRVEPSATQEDLLRQYRRAHVALDLGTAGDDHVPPLGPATLALWCGLPVIRAIDDDLGRAIQAEMAGWVLPSLDGPEPRAIVEAIVRAPALAAARGANAQRLARARLTWATTGESLDGFVRRPLVRRKPARRSAEAASVGDVDDMRVASATD